MNVPPLERYTDVLIAASKAPIDRVECGMFAGTRAGWCRVRGGGNALPAFTAGLAMHGVAHEQDFGEDTCLAFPTFGTGGDGIYRPGPGVAILEPGDSALPANQDNVVLRRVYLSSIASEGCVEFDYPYG